MGFGEFLKVISQFDYIGLSFSLKFSGGLNNLAPYHHFMSSPESFRVVIDPEIFFNIFIQYGTLDWIT